MENKWVVEIINNEPRNYYCLDSLDGKIIYDKYVIVDKDKVDIKDIILYKLINGKLEIDSDKVRLRDIEQLNLKKNIIKKTLHKLKTYYSEKEFVYKGKYLQKNREKGDRDNLTGIAVLLMATGQTEYNGWKVTDKDTGEHIYLKLSLDELKILALHMQEQVTKAMKAESALISKLSSLSDGELKLFNAREEYETLWNS